MIFKRPSVPKEPNGKEKCADEHWWETVFRLFVIVLGFHLNDISIGESAQRKLAEEETEHQTKVGEATLARCERIIVLEDSPDGGETYHSIGITEGAVEAYERDNR